MSFDEAAGPLVETAQLAEAEWLNWLNVAAHICEDG